ncbi:MAG: ferredoxin [Oscillospiraceae bacterium]|nr:ferredoxin [Oscillospiraceae bacterium]
MKAEINRENCIGCGLCASTCPEVFRLADDGFAEAYVDEIPEDVVQTAMDARDDCPVSVIDIN